MSVKPIELPRRVRAVIPAVSNANTSVIDLSIEPVRIVIRRVDGTDRLARRVLAVLTEHRHEPNPGMWILAFPIPFNANPIDRPSLGTLVFSGDADVVFGSTRDHTRFTACAAVEIHDHLPLVGLALFSIQVFIHDLSSTVNPAVSPRGLVFVTSHGVVRYGLIGCRLASRDER